MASFSPMHTDDGGEETLTLALAGDEKVLSKPRDGAGAVLQVYNENYGGNAPILSYSLSGVVSASKFLVKNYGLITLENLQQVEAFKCKAKIAGVTVYVQYYKNTR